MGEHPIYSQAVYCLDRVPALVKAKPELANVEPFKTVMSGDREVIAKLSTHDLEKILFATLTGMTVDTFKAEAKKWTEEAKDRRWKIRRGDGCASTQIDGKEPRDRGARRSGPEFRRPKPIMFGCKPMSRN